MDHDLTCDDGWALNEGRPVFGHSRWRRALPILEIRTAPTDEVAQ